MISNIFIFILALLHFYFLYLEMFLWTKPQGRKIFKTTENYAQQSKVLAANQGLYNGFLACGLIWSLLASSPQQSFELKAFFSGCVFVAGLYGGLTASKNIFFIQALPAFLALITLFL